MSAALHPLAERPIPGPIPGGEDPTGKPAFEALDAEISKLTQLEGVSVDWALVCSLSKDILQNTAKDLRVASYLTRGLFEQQGLAGLAEGLSLLQALVALYWEGCWPATKRLRGRAAAFTWLSEKLVPLLKNRFVDSHDQPTLSQIESDLSALEQALATRMGEHAPDFHEVLRLIKDLRRRTEAEEAVGAIASNPYLANPNGQAEPKAGHGAALLDSASVAQQSLAHLMPPDPSSDRAVKKTFTEAAQALRPHDEENPLFYHMVRYATWRGIRDLPPAAEDGKTALAPVPADRVSQYEKLFAAKKFSELLGLVEQSITRNPFWLAGHHLTDRILVAMNHSDARQAVRYEVCLLVQRLPGLLSLRFSDGSPFADEATTGWIASLAPAQATTPSQPVPANMVFAQGWQDLLAIAREAAADASDPGRAISLLTHLDHGLLSAQDPRSRFLWGLALVHGCLEAGHLALADAQLSHLQQRFNALGLAAWEPLLGADLDSARALISKQLPAHAPSSSPVTDRGVGLTPPAAKTSAPL